MKQSVHTHEIQHTLNTQGNLKTGSVQQVKEVKINIFLILTSSSCWIKPVFRIPAPLGIRYVDMPNFQFWLFWSYSVFTEGETLSKISKAKGRVGGTRSIQVQVSDQVCHIASCSHSHHTSSSRTSC